MNKKEEQEVRKKFKILVHAQEGNSVSKTCRYWGISQDIFSAGKKTMPSKEKRVN